MLRLPWSTLGWVSHQKLSNGAVNQAFPRPTNGGFSGLTMQRGGVLSSDGIKIPTNLVLKPGQFAKVEGDIKKTKQVSMASKIVAKSGSFKSGALVALKIDLGGWFMALRSPISKVDKMGLMFNGPRASTEVENPINHEIGDREPLDPKLGYDGCKVISMGLWLGLIVPLEPAEDWKSWPPNL